jgi:hypothetical protein
MKATFDYSTIKFSLAAYTKDLNQQMTNQLKEAVGVWISTAVSVIPVWTGASHATFVKLAAKIGQSFSVGGGNIPGVRIGPSEGRSASRGTLTAWGGVWVAEYSTTLWHLIYNEYNDGNLDKLTARVRSHLKKPGPYGFQDKANTAFKAYVDKYVRMPKPWNYITVIQRKV